MESAQTLWQQRKGWNLSVAAGVVLGCLYRGMFDVRWGRHGDAALVMTLGFLLIVPFCMGYLVVATYLRQCSEVRWYRWFFLPWLSVLITMAVSVAVKWEGAVCLVFAAPLMLLGSALGGILARAASKQWNRPVTGTAAAFALPLLIMLVEAHVASAWQIRAVETDALHSRAGSGRMGEDQERARDRSGGAATLLG